MDSPDAAMQPFTPGQCLFCSNSLPSFADSVTHMQKSHGLFVPHPQRLIVDLETLFKYLHLIIFGYRECIQCGTERATVQAVQQHMIGKGHCRFDIAEQDSEFAEFYDFSEPEEGEESEVDFEEDGNIEEAGESEERDRRGNTSSSPSRNPVLADEESIRLPSGKIVSRQTSSIPAGPSFTQLRRRTRTSASQLEYSIVAEPDEDEAVPGKEQPGSADTQILSKREKREKAAVTYQLANMSASDRNSLVHLPASQQLAILAAQYRHAEKVQQEERRRRSKIDRKGNKNLYAYWHTETPVYQCG
ncbi:hypothetical protein SLS62_008090 [Diatrype stigma]|uniref:ZN622/Rei1/Reh1 zinc finger C2H2-type domain-containing protein n=1 Tax=Diatrype stigma TaxID=117547 RepID=A0AAN9ULM0_9PEZI